MSSLLSRALRGEPLDGFPMVDMHVHFDAWSAMHMPATNDALIAKMDRVGVDLACMNPIILPDVVEGNTRLAEFAGRHPDRVAPFAGLSPYASRPMADELRRCFDELGFVGIKLHSMVANGPHSPFPLTSAKAGWEAVWELAAARRAPVLFHGVVTPEVIRRYPDIPFIRAHGSAATHELAPLADCPNLYADTAATQNPAGAVDRLVEVLGVDRVLWGTDAPTVDFSQRLGVVLDSELSEENQKRILGGSALQVLENAGYQTPRRLCSGASC